MTIKDQLRHKATSFAKRVAPLYQELKWEWDSASSINHIPNEKEIKSMILDLIYLLDESKLDIDCSVLCGGIQVGWDVEADVCVGPIGYIRFIVEKNVYEDEKVNLTGLTSFVEGKVDEK